MSNRCGPAAQSPIKLKTSALAESLPLIGRVLHVAGPSLHGGRHAQPRPQGSHVFAGGYAAGYYSYLWAELLACDAWQAFADAGMLCSQTAHRYLVEILERGGSRPAAENFAAFRGRQPTIDALLKQRGLSRALSTRSSVF